MKIGFNAKRIMDAFQETIYFFSSKVSQNESNIANHETRISALENRTGSEASSGDGVQ